MTHQSLPPDSNARFRTDARPFGDISERDADALDAWLDRHSATTRTGESPSSVDHHTIGQNGQTPTANDVPTPLTAAAQRFHARLESAERNDAPAIPESAIWENVMSSHLAINRPVSPLPIPIKDKTSGTSSRPRRAMIGSNPALSVMLAAALLIAIVALFRGFNGDGSIAPPPPLNGNGSDYGFSIFATPAASSSSTRCEMREVSANTAERLEAERLAAPAPVYLPVEGVAPMPDANAAISSFVTNQDCRMTTDPKGKLFTTPGWTDRFFADYQLQRSTESRVVIRKQSLAASRELSPILAVPDPTAYIFDADDPAVKPFLIYTGTGHPTALFPDQFVTLADGRIAAPMNWAIPGGAQGYTKDDYTSSVAIPFLIFANVNGNWLLDETVPLCTVFCDQFYTSEQTSIDNDLAWIAARPTADANPSTLATPSTSSTRCEMREVSADTAKRIEAERLAAPAPVYLPIQGPAPISDGNAAFSSFLTGMDCSMTAEPSGKLFASSSGTDRYFADEQLQKNIETRVIVREQRLATSRELSPILAVPDPTAYVFDLDDPAVKPFQFFIGTGYSYVLFPDQFVILADGRIVAPTNLAIPGGTQSYAKSAFTPWVIVPFTIFANVNGNWLLDEVALLCIVSCDEYYASEQAAIDNDLASIAAHPTATSATTTPSSTRQTSGGDNQRSRPTPLPTTEGADRWREPITDDECLSSFALGDEDETVALAARRFLACADDDGQMPESLLPYLTDDLKANHPELADNQYTAQAKDIEDAQAISKELGWGSSQLYILGLPGADDTSKRTEGFYEVFLPTNAVKLQDGRIAIPYSLAFPDSTALKKAQESVAAKSPAEMPIAGMVFAHEDGIWKVDQLIFMCNGACDEFWANATLNAGTPSSSNQGIATATAIAAESYPISPDECVNPTTAASTNELPTRGYSPVLKPTSPRATAVTDAARNVIACIAEASGDATPGKNLEPMMTDRLRDEFPADGSDPDLTEAQINGAQYVSEYLADEGFEPYARAPEGVHDQFPDVWPGEWMGDSTDRTPGWYQVAMYDHAMQFPDNRLAIPITTMVTSDDLWSFLQGESMQTGVIYFFVPDNGNYRLDETLPYCLGNCDTFWQDPMYPDESTPTAGLPSVVPRPTMPSDENVIRPITTEPVEAPSPTRDLLGGDNLRSDTAMPSPTMPSGENVISPITTEPVAAPSPTVEPEGGKNQRSNRISHTIDTPIRASVASRNAVPARRVNA